MDEQTGGFQLFKAKALCFITGSGFGQELDFVSRAVYQLRTSERLTPNETEFAKDEAIRGFGNMIHSITSSGCFDESMSLTHDIATRIQTEFNNGIRNDKPNDASRALYELEQRLEITRRDLKDNLIDVTYQPERGQVK